MDDFWNGVERRSSGDGALREIHRRIDDHLEAERKDAERIASLEQQVSEMRSELRDIQSDIKEMLEIKQQARGGIRLLLALGSAVAAGAAAWTWIVAQLEVLKK